MLMGGDTIAAQATAVGEGGIAIVRMSGPQSEAILSKVFRPLSKEQMTNRLLTLGHVMDGEEAVDEAMAVLMRAPHSYTREDVAEIHCHGSQALVRRVLLLLLANGARMAKPGEFTCRAFLGGRIDLAQAEAVMRLVRADSDRAIKSAMRQLEGGVSGYVRKAREELIALLAALSAATDFPDEVEEVRTAREVADGCRALCERLRAGCDPRIGRMEDEGLRVVLCGLPNAGKSSLLNALLGGERAIVTSVPGTTRDTLTEPLQMDGLRVLLTDTAGLRDARDEAERMGVERAQKALSDADVRLLVLDGSQPLSGADAKMLAALSPDIVALTKADLPSEISPERALSLFAGASVVSVCAPRGEGLDALGEAMASFAPAVGTQSAALTQSRHVEAAMRACASLEDAQRAIAQGMPLDVCAIDLSAALDALGEITGETLRETVIDEVFSRFCVGK